MKSDAAGAGKVATTHRSLRGTHESSAALERLCQSYWLPLHGYVRRHVSDVHDAQELTQAFFERLLGKNYLADADSQRGRFRVFFADGVQTLPLQRVTETERERIVAIKILRKDQLGPEECEAFLREARATVQLRHPNIVSVHEVSRTGDMLYIISDYVEGRSLGLVANVVFEESCSGDDFGLNCAGL